METIKSVRYELAQLFYCGMGNGYPKFLMSFDKYEDAVDMYHRVKKSNPDFSYMLLSSKLE